MPLHERPQVALIAGGENHDIDGVRRQLLALLGKDEAVRVRCDAEYPDGTALADKDLLISYTSNVFPTAAGRDAIAAFLERGGRWIAIHAAAAYTEFRPPEIEFAGIRLPGLTDTPDREPEFMDLLGLRFVSHLAQQGFTVEPGPVAHPVTEGIKPFTVIDEPYILELRRDWDVLLTAHYTGEAPGYVEGPWLEDLPRPQLLHRQAGRGAIMYCAPGHACGRYDLRPYIDVLDPQPGPWAEPAFIGLMRRLIAWGLEQVPQAA